MNTAIVNLGKHRVGRGQPVFIIAETGVNHNGKLGLAKKMVDAAKKSGVDAIKFQVFKAGELATPEAPKARYQKKNAARESQLEMLKRLELSESDFRQLFYYCRMKKLGFLATPFDFSSADFLNRLGVMAFKIGSGDLNNIPFLTRIARYHKPVILSTGMSSLSEVAEAVDAIYTAGNRKLILLHCTSSYPTRYEDVNLKAMNTLKEEFNLPVGYSDHTEGLEVSIAAVALGAVLIERHFTLDKFMLGPDHAASLDVQELTRLVKAIRCLEKALGDGKKKARNCESEVKRAARKSIVARRDLAAGSILTDGMLAIKRSGIGIKPGSYYRLIGKRIKKALVRDDPLRWEMIA